MNKVEKVSKLVNGLIPANTVCPFKSVCPKIDFVFPGLTEQHNLCYHRGNNLNTRYFCITARGFDDGE